MMLKILQQVQTIEFWYNDVTVKRETDYQSLSDERKELSEAKYSQIQRKCETECT